VKGRLIFLVGSGFSSVSAGAVIIILALTPAPEGSEKAGFASSCSASLLKLVFFYC